MGRGRKLVFGVVVFLCTFVVDSLHAVDLSPLIYSPSQPFSAMTAHYDARALSMVDGHGLLFPDDRRKIDTSLMAFSAGYSIFVGAVYYLFGQNFFTVQLFQDLLCALTAVLLFLIAGELISWRVGIAAGLLASVYHGIAFFSNFILPDSLVPLPILAATYSLVIAWSRRSQSCLPFLTAGFMLGLSLWLRPNALLLGPYCLAVLLLSYKKRRWLFPRVGVMVAASFLVLAPITIRNYVMFRRFVPDWIGVGMTLWIGIGEESGGRFGAPQTDDELGLQEAAELGNRHYSWWATPEGVERDRARIAKSLAVIVRNPVWYARVMGRRMLRMMQCSEWAPLVDVHFGERNYANTPEVPSKAALTAGTALSFLRRPVKALERLAKETTLTFVGLGAIITYFISRRRWGLILIVPSYYLFFQSAVHTEFRYVLAIHYFFAIFGGVVWCLLAYSATSTTMRLLAQLRCTVQRVAFDRE
jgi:hypothetical protein